jgi:hypothetical protein
MNTIDLQNLKIIKDSLEPTSELFASIDKMISLLSTNVYYLFGYNQVSHYMEDGIEKVVNEIEKCIFDGEFHLFNKVEEVTKVISNFEGWRDYTIISEEDYNKLKNATPDYSGLKEWMNSDNVIKCGKDAYKEQCTQWKKVFTYEELKTFYIREFKNS